MPCRRPQLDVERAATPTVTLGGAAIDPAAMQFSGCGKGNGGLIMVCPNA
jgi:hypothetical protein